ncbi:hypothetical protein F4775DRAFT_600540 [Biscogniauxia sp. FL1348]|nr:hypothetical protein F4775DRAFT_600540 [Biscogniauxia sp. FL1348]
MHPSILILGLLTLGASSLQPAETEVEVNTDQAPKSTSEIKRMGVIPVHDWGCHPEEPKLNPINIQKVKEDFALWSSKENRVFPNSVKIFTWGDTAWYICNCKTWHYDPVPMEELNDAQSILTHYCGRDRSGWVWSKKWNKGYNLVSSDYVKYALHQDLCPKGCFT